MDEDFLKESLPILKQRNFQPIQSMTNFTELNELNLSKAPLPDINKPFD